MGMFEDLRNRVINWALVEKPVFSGKVIRRLTASKSNSKGGGAAGKGKAAAALPAATAASDAAAPVDLRFGGASSLPRDNGLRAANIAAGVPGAR